MVDPDSPDEVLMADVGGGDELAFNMLVERYGRPLLNFIYRFVGDCQLARDLYQETFLRVYRAARSYHPARKFSTWLFQIAANLCIDELRRRRVARLLETNLGVDRAPEGLAALTEAHAALPHDWQSGAVEDPAQMAERKELSERVQAAIQALPADARVVLILRHYQGLSYQEISEIVHCPVGTVKSRLHYALQALKPRLLEQT
jgi:RNA polymerase sigma-70 factor (ECF subfamily)